MNESTKKEQLCPTCGATLKKQNRIMVDLDFNIAIIDGVAIKFTASEAVIMHSLAARAPRVVEHWLLMDHVYGLEIDQPQQKIIDVFIFKIRRKLKETDFRIRTVWGKGYYLIRASSEDKQLSSSIKEKRDETSHN